MESTNFNEKRTETEIKDPITLTVPAPKRTLADIRYGMHIFGDAMVIAPRKDRKFANDVISVIKNSNKIERREDLEKKQVIKTFIYDVDDLRLEVECKRDNGDECNYCHARMITVIHRKSKQIIDRITKPFLVARVDSTIINKKDQIHKSKKTLESARQMFQKMSEKANGNQTQR